MVPMILKRCLAHRVQIYPHQLDSVLRQYEKAKIPDAILANMGMRDLEDYVKGLYLSGCEMAGDWTEGYKMLKKLGFTEKKREQGHRTFISLVYS